MQRNTIGSLGAKSLGSMLQVNKYLLILNLHGNFIGDAGVKSMCPGLRKNHTLLELNLGNNDISGEGMADLAKALEVSQVQILNMIRNPLRNKGAEVIGHMI